MMRRRWVRRAVLIIVIWAIAIVVSLTIVPRLPPEWPDWLPWAVAILVTATGFVADIIGLFGGEVGKPPNGKIVQGDEIQRDKIVQGDEVHGDKIVQVQPPAEPLPDRRPATVRGEGVSTVQQSLHLLHVEDVKDGQIQVSWQQTGGLARSCDPLPFTDPLTPDDRRELRWYLEKYLGFPYGAERDRAGRVEERMAGWGESLFHQVFPKRSEDPDPRGFYQEAVRSGLERCELCISSDDPGFLNVPWELMRDPVAGRGYLAPSLAGLFRRRSGHRIEADVELDTTEGFRILLVIARPFGERDVPLGTVARPVLEAIRPLRPRVQLEVLRPPTFEALVARLNERRGTYHLVHFDGHGVFAGSGAGPVMQFGAGAARGHLVFETEEGGARVVDSQELGQALATCKVPLFVLNACQSGEEGAADPFSSVASQLVAVGARGVVAMSYSVHAGAAAQFMARFYEWLMDHASLSEAVAAGRRRLHAGPERDSVVGPLALRDWPVPVLYQEEVRYVPVPEEVGAAAVREEPAGGVERRPAEEVCPEGQFGFVGRDYDLLRIERALREDRAPWALITGLGGTGKTELASGFARWYAETGGCPGGVFAASFKEQAGFGQVVGSVMGHGTDFSRLPGEAQWQLLVGYLRDNACLLVWDNFETVGGYPQDHAPLATQEERERLARFLRALRGGKSGVILTTRKPEESWLGIACELVEIGGLTDRDAAQLAERILRTVGRRPQDYREDADYARLISLLRGHPRSLEVVLPHLRRRTPRQVIDALQHRIESLGGVLDASLDYGFAQLSARTQKHLPVVGLFTSHVRLDLIVTFVSSGDRRAVLYQEVIGEKLDAVGWKAVLDEAASVGLIRTIANPTYGLHPTLPAFLRQRLASAVGEEGLRRLDGEFRRFYAGWAAHSFEGVRRGEKAVVALVVAEEANLLRALRLAEMAGAWREAGLIAQTLGEFYRVRGRAPERSALRARLLCWVGREMPPTADRDRAYLWMYLLGDEANDALQRGSLAAAEAAHRWVLDYLLSLGDPEVQPRVAVAYHQLGRIAEQRSEFEAADGWYRRALEIRERLGLQQEAATDDHELGNVALRRQRFDEADGWYRRALEVRERLGLERDAASDYHQMGIIAQERTEFDEADGWYRRALEIRERLGLERDAVSDYHQMGIIAQEQQRFEEAVGWYRKALEISERLGLERDAASDYHQLGNVACLRHRFEEAEEWYYKALGITEHLELEQYAALQYHQLGRIAEERGELGEAEGWYRKALEIHERLRLVRDAAGEYYQLGSVALRRQRFDEAQRWYRRALGVFEQLGHPPYAVETLAQMGVLRGRQGLPEEAVGWLGRAYAIASAFRMPVLGQILTVLAGLMRSMGEEAFVRAWQQALPEQEAPLDALRQILGQLRGEEG